MSRIEGPIDQKVIAKITARATSNAVERVHEYSRECNEYIPGDTPIERVLIVAVMAELSVAMRELERLIIPEIPGAFFKDRAYETGGPYLFCAPQAKVLDWPVDFLFTVVSPHRKHKGLVVECDGHDFHERTKSQASRDRSRDRRIQEAGYSVFRFTGSEIWKDPCKCADSVIDWAVNEYCA